MKLLVIFLGSFLVSMAAHAESECPKGEFFKSLAHIIVSGNHLVIIGNSASKGVKQYEDVGITRSGYYDICLKGTKKKGYTITWANKRSPKKK